MVNLLEPGDVTLSCQNGLWGERYAEMAERNGKACFKKPRAVSKSSCKRCQMVAVSHPSLNIVMKVLQFCDIAVI